MTNPTVSVLLPVYNGEKFIAEAVQSMLEQTYRDFELIVIDDGSTDRTAAILDQFHDTRILRLRNPENLGLVRSLNLAAQKAQGKYLARMDADDVSHPARLEKQVKFFELNPEVGVVGTAVRQTDARGRALSTLVYPETHELIFWRFFFGLALQHPTVMLRADLFNAVHGYNEEFPCAQDTELWSRLLERTKFANLPEVLHYRRMHGKSVGSAHYAAQRRYDAEIRRAFFTRVIGSTPSLAACEWLVEPTRFLPTAYKAELIALIGQFYKYMEQTFELTPGVRAYLKSNMQRRLSAARLSDRRPAVKFIFRVVRDNLPIATRHRLKQSKLGRFLARYI
ncbi:glycosyltransferase [Candidatus Uhrbacteria bacterium]|nr:glycosyltransferase [Candidatus Uhrbacteria bacterium]